mgnify:CR=1 FL=1
MKKERNDLVGGLVLVGLGVVFLIGRFFKFDGLPTALLILGGLALMFGVAGMVTRESGYFVPSGILGGIGLGIGLMSIPLSINNGDAEGALFLLGFAAGWVAIVGLTAVFSNRTQWWPIIPGGIMAIIGGSLLVGEVGISLLEGVGNYWPVILIVIGVYVIVEQFFGKGQKAG